MFSCLVCACCKDHHVWLLSPVRTAHPTWLRCQPATGGQQSAWWTEPSGTEEFTSSWAKACVPSTTSCPLNTSERCRYLKTRPWTGSTKRWENQHGWDLRDRTAPHVSASFSDRWMLSFKKTLTKPQSSFLKALTRIPSLLQVWPRFIRLSSLTGHLWLWRSVWNSRYFILFL